MAPEVYKDETFDRSVDAFSFGLILYEVNVIYWAFIHDKIEHIDGFHVFDAV